MAFSWKAARDIMRKDSSVSTEYQRLEEFVSLVFLRIYNALEEEWADEADSNGRSYTPAIPEEYQWGAWAIKRADGTSLTGDSLVEHLNKLYRHCATMSVVGLEPRQMIVRKVFQGLTQHMRDGYQLRQLIDLVNELNYHDAKQRHLFGQMYEEMLRIMQSSKETGEYYTPRAVTKFIVEQLNPQLGEKFGDFACGTGGFLTAAIDHLQAQGVETKKQVEQLQNAIVGCELKAIPYLLCATNMLVHGIDNPAITQGTAFSKNINDYDEKDKVNVVGMNPPYGGMTTSTELTNFPENVRTSETAVLFLAYICKRMKENGRAGVIIPDGFLFGSDNASIEVKMILLKEMNLHTIIRLPSSVFAPYTSITTNILFFDNKRATDAPNGFKTKDVWIYRMDMPEGFKHFSKTKPIQPEHMQVVKDWWENRVEIADPTDDPAKITYKAKCYSVQEIAESGYNLDLCKYPQDDEIVLPSDDLIECFDMDFKEHIKTISQSLSNIHSILFEDRSVNHLNTLSNACSNLQRLISSFPEKLLKSVLLDAIRGRLVPQNPSDEPAIELLKRIRKEKADLVKAGRIKKKDLDSEPILSEEYPFEKPCGWEFVRLSEISLDSADGPFGSNLKKEHYTDQKQVRIIQLSNIGEFGWKDSNVKYTTFEHLKTISRSEAFAGDIIIAKMMPAGRAIICPDIDIKYVLSSDAVRFAFSSILDKRYLYYAINSPVFKDQVYGEVQGITRVRTSLSKLRTYILPIPPLSEQHRIVEKIEEVFSAIDKLKA